MSDQRLTLRPDRAGQIQAGKPKGRQRPLAMIAFVIYLILVQLYYVVFQGASSSLLDESFALIMAVPGFFALKAFARLRTALILFTVYAGITILGNLVYRYGGVTQPWAALLDMGLDLKPFLIESGFVYLFWRSRNPKRQMEGICIAIIVAALLNSIFVLYDLRAGSVGFMGRPLEWRNGLYQPMGYQVDKVRSAALTMLGASFSIYFAIARRSTIAIYSALYLSALVFLHQSAKEMAAFILILPFFLPGRKVAGIRPLLWGIGLGTLAILIVVTPIGDFFTDRVSYFTGNSGGDKARTLLVERGFDIAKDHAPLGTGAGTFGSAPSFQMGYSDVYYNYGFTKVFGATPDNPNFLQDAFWGKIMGQSGFAGMIAYLALLIVALGACFQLDRMQKDSSAIPACAAAMLALLTSTASSPFSDDFVGVVLAAFSGYAILALRARIAARDAGKVADRARKRLLAMPSPA